MLHNALSRTDSGTDVLAVLLARAAPCAKLDGGGAEVLARLFDRTVELDRGEHFRRAGEDRQAVFVLREGWAARYLQLPDGRRQIVELLLPGDLFPVDRTTGSTGEGIVALEMCRAAVCPPRVLEDALLDHAGLARSLWLQCVRSKRIAQMWITNIGQRDSFARIAHLVCEISERLALSGVAHGGAFPMPMTQEDLADASGITSVHANRVLRDLRCKGLFELRCRRARILDPDGLARAAAFDGSYLRPTPRT